MEGLFLRQLSNRNVKGIICSDIPKEYLHLPSHLIYSKLTFIKKPCFELLWQLPHNHFEFNPIDELNVEYWIFSTDYIELLDNLNKTY